MAVVPSTRHEFLRRSADAETFPILTFETGTGSPTLVELVTVDEVRSIAATLPRSYEVTVRGCVKFRVGQLVYVAFDRDELIMGFGFPRELRDSLVDSDPDKFLLPRQSDLRYNWVCVRVDAIDLEEMSALVISAWRMCVPKKVYAAYEQQSRHAAVRRRM
jgi:hypothetical protein